MTDGAWAVELSEVSKTYRVRRREVQALDRVTLRIPRGQILGLLGPNGAGKTTTIRILAGLVAPTSGEARVHGRSVARQAQQARALVGLVPEDAGNHRNLTIREELGYYGALYGLSRREVRARAQPLLDRLGLGGLVDRRTRTLSKGTCRKIHMVRALLHRPRVLLLDEPTDGLDPLVAAEAWEVLRTLARDQGVTVVLCSHHLEEVQKLCQHVAIIQQQILFERDLGARIGRDARYRIELAGPAEPWLGVLAGADAGVGEVRAEGHQLWLAITGESAEVVPRLVRTLAAAGAPIVAVGPANDDLRSLYRRTLGAAVEGEG